MKKFKNQIRRSLSLAVALSMCLGTLQVTAFADDTEGGSPAAESGSNEGSSSAAESNSNESRSTDGTTDTGVSVSVSEKESTTNEDGSVSGGSVAEGVTKDGNKIEIDNTTTSKDDGKEVTEDIKVTITEEGKDHVLVPGSGEEKEVFAPTDENKDLEKVEENSSETGEFDLNQEIKVDGWVGNGDKNGTTEDHKDQSINYEELVEKLKPDTSEWGEKKTDDSKDQKTYWETKKEDGTIVRKSFEAIKDEKGNVVGYKTITETITTKEGEYKETGETSRLDGEVPSLPMDGNEEPGDVPTKVTLPEKPEVGTVVNEETGETVTAVVDNEDGSYTVTYETITGEPTLTPRVDENGNPVLNEAGEQIVDVVYPTETRTETFKYVTNEDSYQVAVGEERKDEVIIDTVVDINKVDLSQDSLKLDLKLETADKSELTGRDGLIFYDGNEEITAEEYVNRTKGLKEYLSENAINMNFLVGTTVTVTQSKAGSNDYDANATIKLNLNKSQLNDDFVLKVNDTVYRVPKDVANREAGNFLEFDENGNVKDIHVANVKTGDITLQLVGKQQLDFTSADLGWGDCTMSPAPLDKYVDLTATVHVTITEIKGTKVEEQFEGKDTDEDVKNFTRTDTVTEIETSLTTTVTDPVADTRNDTTTQPYTPPETPETPETPTTGGGGTGTTGTVTVADGSVPMAEAPEVEVPETEVPLAETPVEMEIPEEAVPLADSTEVVIADDAVPLADVPKTGDISDLWYAAALLSACGLAALNGKKREEEDA